MNTQYLKITRASENQRVSGVLASAALVGTPVQFTSTGTAGGAHADNTTLIKANTGEGKIYFLNREVINETSQPLENLVFGNDEVNPVLVNNPVDVIEALEIEAEGGDDAGDGKADYILLAADDATHGFAGNEAAGTRLTIVAGKWGKHVTAASQAVCGRLVKWLTPVDSNNLRALIEVYSDAQIDKLV